MTDFDDEKAPLRGPYWRLDVKDFGKVASAQIEMAPLVVLLGRNNTGKSYVASLIWSILNFSEMYQTKRPSQISELPDWYKHVVRDEDVDSNETYLVDKSALEIWLNDLLAGLKDEVAERILSFRSASIGELKLSFLDKAPDVFLTRSLADEDETPTARINLSAAEDGNSHLDFKINARSYPTAFIARAFSFVLDASMYGKYPDSSAVYIPAARTGLMLALRPLISSTLQTLGLDEKRRADRLSLPTIKFLQSLATITPDRGSGFLDVAAFLEREILKGKIVSEDDGPDRTFSYQTESEMVLPLYASSSMVTEIAPLLLLLRAGNFDRGLIFEEPEAHLHLAAQRSMARAIAQIVNKGVPVVITTHSDTFVQELNLLMQIKQSDNRADLMQKYGYKDDELLASSEVRAYEFIESDKRTFVVQAEVGEYGIVAESLNETLTSIADEVITVQSGIGSAA